MSNQDNDQDSFDTDLGFEDGQDTGGKKSNPLIKIGLIAVGLVAVVVAIMSFGGKSTEAPKSAVGAAPVDGKALPAQKDPTPAMRDALENYNTQIIEQAKEEGSSVIPIPIDPSRKQIETKVQESQEDPAERFRRIQEEYRRQQENQMVSQQGQAVQADAAARAQAVQSLSQGMSTYLTEILKQREPMGTSGEITVTYKAPDDGTSNGTGTNGGVGGTGTSGSNLIKPKIILPATTIEYGQLMIEANTDSPGPVLALMVTGKLAGSRLLGKFQKTDNYLTIQFDTLVTKDGKSVKIQAIVIDPDTTLPGMITEIDHRYFQRIVVPAAADFISGVGEALSETQTSTNQTSTSTVTTSEKPDFSDAIAQGITDSFDGISEVLKDQAKEVEPMLRVAAGTPIGILFTQEVLDPDDAATLAEQQAAQAQLQMQQQQANNPYGYMNGQPGYGGYPMQPPQYAPVNAPATPAAAPATAQ